MSGAKRLPRQAISDSAVSAINDHAERIDDLVEERNVLTHRVNDIAERVEKLEKPSRLAQTHADLMEALDDKPKPAKSWAQRMRDAVFEERWRAQQGQGLDAAAIDTLIAEAEAAMKHEWSPMATAPRDGRWVLLRRRLGGGGLAPAVTAKWSANRWRDPNSVLVLYWPGEDVTGWLPIPGEGDA